MNLFKYVLQQLEAGLVLCGPEQCCFVFNNDKFHKPKIWLIFSRLWLMVISVIF